MVAGPLRPEYSAFQSSVLVEVSRVIAAVPVPLLSFGGVSAAPSILAVKCRTAAEADPAANTITDEQATDAEEAAELAAAIAAQQAELAAKQAAEAAEKAAEQAAEAADQQGENTDEQQDGDVENQAGNTDQGHDQGGD